MKRLLFLVFILSSTLSLFAQQETCTTSEESLVDVNSITKCSLEPVKKSKENRQIKVKVSAKKRYLKKRVLTKKKSVQSMSSIHTAGLSEVETPIKKIDNIAEKEIQSEVKEESNFKENLKRLTEKLSKEELAKAIKLYHVDNIPSFNQCKNVKKKEKLDCFNHEMVKHINKHFRYPSEAVRDQIQGEVWIRFIIDKEGYITNVKTLGPDGGEILNDEAKRVVSKLPHFEPGKHKGKRVSVKYGFPINFSLEE